MKLVTTMAAAISLLALSTTSSAVAGTTTIITGCPAYAPLIAGVTFNVTGEQVTGSRGNVWATADYRRLLGIYRVGRNSYCATWRDTGTFTTVEGPAPGSWGWLDGGIPGTLVRTAVTTNFTATWNPKKPTSGYIGTYEAPVDWTSFYFDGVQGLDLVWWSNLYQTLTNGCWANRTGYPSIGNIASSY
jgi:hypothetical protein